MELENVAQGIFEKLFISMNILDKFIFDKSILRTYEYAGVIDIGRYQNVKGLCS